MMGSRPRDPVTDATLSDPGRTGSGALCFFVLDRFYGGDGRGLAWPSTTTNVRCNAALLASGASFIARELVSGSGSMGGFATLASDLANLGSIHRREAARSTGLGSLHDGVVLGGGDFLLRDLRGGVGGGIEHGIHGDDFLLEVDGQTSPSETQTLRKTSDFQD